MKLIFAFLLLMLSVKLSSAQTGYFDKQGKDLSSFLKGKMHHPISIMDNCQMPFTYVKFKITKDNTVDSLIVTNSSSPDVQNEIVRVMEFTNGYWNVEQTQGKWLIVPIVFHTEFNKNARGRGCDFKKILADQSKEMRYENKEPNAVYFPLVMIYGEWKN
ncbi:MAG: hypothetical protein EOP47_21740 [Sphingobacteriaceae bacterium]|nr:MAG: hypothetical protein EOP47_21740 [Sphingobacteriaceae bacterium]